MPLTIEVADEHSLPGLDHQRLKQAVERVLAEAGIEHAEISVAVVDDARMHELNRKYLDHDYPTDVLSFILEHDEARHSLEGQIIVSADYAAREAARYGWSPADELLLYVIHGALHLVGHDDQQPEARHKMRLAETEHLARFGLSHRY